MRKYKRTQRGVTLLEYSILISLIAIASLAAFTGLLQDISAILGNSYFDSVHTLRQSEFWNPYNPLNIF